MLPQTRAIAFLCHWDKNRVKNKNVYAVLVSKDLVVADCLNPGTHCNNNSQFLPLLVASAHQHLAFCPLHALFTSCLAIFRQPQNLEIPGDLASELQAQPETIH